MPNVPKEADVYTYCGAGGRAGQAAVLLRSKGWVNVQNLGGLKDWQAAGGAVEK
jgi:rhodanese-related sulfurtransferase